MSSFEIILINAVILAVLSFLIILTALLTSLIFATFIEGRTKASYNLRKGLHNVQRRIRMANRRIGRRVLVVKGAIRKELLKPEKGGEAGFSGFVGNVKANFRKAEKGLSTLGEEIRLKAQEAEWKAQTMLGNIRSKEEAARFMLIESIKKKLAELGEYEKAFLENAKEKERNFFARIFKWLNKNAERKRIKKKKEMLIKHLIAAREKKDLVYNNLESRGLLARRKRLSVDSLIGKKVYSEGGDSFGIVEEALLDDLRINSLVIGLDYEHALRYNAEQAILAYNCVSGIGDIVLLDERVVEDINRKLNLLSEASETEQAEENQD
jgi:sporulation protein YlmC with PRC-barrel domain